MATVLFSRKLFTSLHYGAANKRWTLIACVAVSLTFLVSSVNAQIEEIVVTAQKREQSIQDVAGSIVAFTQEDMAYHSLGDSGDIDNLVPNMIINGAFADTNPIINIRGVVTSDFTLTFQSAVGVYDNEVYLGSPVGATNAVFDLERIEVLRGPQGTLYGRNTTGGAVNFVSRRPGDSFAVNGRVGYGNLDAVTAEAGIDVPLIPGKLNARLAGIHRERDGHTLNRLTGKDVTGVDSTAGRLSLDFFPNEDITARLIFSTLFHRGDGLQAVHANPTGPGGTDFSGYSDPDGNIDYAGDFDYPGREDVDHFAVTGLIDWDLGWATLKSITAYRDVELDRQEGPDANPNPLFHVKWTAEHDQFSQELRLHSPEDQRLRWIGGLYYYSDDLEGDTFAITNAFGGAVNWQNQLEVTSFATFLNLEYDLTDKWRLRGGIRWTDEERDNGYLNQFRAMTDPTSPDLGSINGPILFPFVPFTQEKRNWDAFTGKVGIDYSFSEDVMAFASFSRGFKSGGFNGFVFSAAALEPFDPEFINAFEMGLKSTWADGRLQANLTGFYYDIEDYQVQALLDTGAVPVTTWTNATSAENKGFELELRAIPVDALDLGVGVGYTDSEIDPFELTPGRIVTGGRPPSTPEWNVNGRAIYTFPLDAGGSVSIGADFVHTSSYLFGVDPAEAAGRIALGTGSQTLVNARIAYTTANGHHSMALWGKNILDKTYNHGGYSNQDFGHDGIFLNTPATYGIEYTFNFD